MTEAEWLTCRETHPMLSFVKANVDQRRVLLLLVACCKAIWNDLPDICKGWVGLLEEVADGRLPLRVLDQDWMDVELELNNLDVPSDGRGYSLLTLATGGGLGYWSDDCPFERGGPAWEQAEAEHTLQIREIFGNPFRPVTFSPQWRTTTAVQLARQMYESREFGAMPILADALQDAGCDSTDVLTHCREPGAHVRGCWVVDLVLGKA